MIDTSRYADIIASISGAAAYKISGVASLSAVPGRLSRRRAPKSVQVAFPAEDRATVDIYINAFSGASVPDLAFDIQQIVKSEVEKATAFKVSSVNIYVTGIVFNQ